MRRDPSLPPPSIELRLALNALEVRVPPVRSIQELLHPPARETLDFLTRAMGRDPAKHFEYPAWFVVLLGEMGRRLHDPSEVVRALAVPVHRYSLADPDSPGFWTALTAGEALARLGSWAIPVLEEILEEGGSWARIVCYGALGAIGTDRAVELLLRAAEDDVELADAVARALHDTGRRKAVEPLYRLLARCRPHHRPQVEDSIRALHHGGGPAPPAVQDWRFRYRPVESGWPFDPGWVGYAGMDRNQGVAKTSRPIVPVRALEEILAEGPLPWPDADEDECAACGRPGRVRYGIPVCEGHGVGLAAVQRSVLEPWAEGFEDLFDVLGEAELDVMGLVEELRERRASRPPRPGRRNGRARATNGRPSSSDADADQALLEEWVVRSRIVRDTCLGFLGRGVEELDAALEELDAEARGSGPARFPLSGSARAPDRKPELEPVQPPDHIRSALPDPKHLAGLVDPRTGYLVVGWSSRPEAQEEVPAEIRRKITEEFKDLYYEHWIRSPLPALGGLTPREAADMIIGGQAVKELLLEFEEIDRQCAEAGGFDYDFSWIWKDLCLDRPGGGAGAGG